MAGERPILIIDDDDALRSTLVEQLHLDAEFTVDQAASLADASEKLAGTSARFDALILDVTLPDGDGRDFCSDLRRQGRRMPIIMLTGSDDESDVVRGLDAGANDYVAKPFRIAELLARLRAQMRIFENSEDAVFSIGPYTFRPSAKLLQEAARNRRIRLTEKEAAILKFLYRAGTRPVPRQVLSERGLGLQRRGHHPHAGDPHLPAEAEDRAGSGQCLPAGDRRRRLPAGSRGRPERLPAAGGASGPGGSRAGPGDFVLAAAVAVRAGRRAPGMIRSPTTKLGVPVMPSAWASAILRCRPVSDRGIRSCRADRRSGSSPASSASVHAAACRIRLQLNPFISSMLQRRGAVLAPGGGDRLGFQHAARAEDRDQLLDQRAARPSDGGRAGPGRAAYLAAVRAARVVELDQGRAAAGAGAPGRRRSGARAARLR